MTKTTKLHGHYEYAAVTASAGTYLDFPVGSGLFKVNLSLNTNDISASVYWMSFRWKNDLGGLRDFLIASGHIDQENHAHVQNVEFEGPGRFTAFLLPANAPSNMAFMGYVRRIRP